MKILINAISLHAGGGKVVGVGIISALGKILDKDDSLIVISPKNHGYKNLEIQKNIKIISASKTQVIFYKLFFNKSFKFYIKKFNVNILLNLCNIPFQQNIIPQITYFHISHFVYPESTIWKKISFINRISFKYIIFLFKKSIKYSQHFFAQTTNIKTRLNKVYNIPLKSITLAPTAVDFSNFKYTEKKTHTAQKNFLYLTRYYEHKNIEVLIEVARLIKQQKLDYSIILTIKESDSPQVKNILKVIAKEKLDTVIDNKGFINHSLLPDLYSEVDALIMPTLFRVFKHFILGSHVF